MMGFKDYLFQICIGIIGICIIFIIIGYIHYQTSSVVGKEVKQAYASNEYGNNTTGLSYSTIEEIMDKLDNITKEDGELLGALRLAWKYLKPDMGITYAVYVTPAEALRREADRIEQKERDIEIIKKILKKYEKRLNREGSNE